MKPWENKAWKEVDTQALDALLMIDPDLSPSSLVHQVIHIYLDTTPDNLKKIKDGISNQDLVAISGQAHTLKSASANVGGKNLSSQCQILESAAKQGQWPLIQSTAAHIEEIFKVLKAELEEILKG